MSFISKGLRRLKLKKGRFPDDGSRGINLIDIQAMPSTAHLSCPHCAGHRFHVESQLNGVTTACEGCGWESKLNLLFDPPSKCPVCQNDTFILMKMSDVFASGCSKCSWETRLDLKEQVTPGGIILSH